ncbi:MAG: PD-(D/E)XK nuclease family protein, partial [Acidimicrobiales bacterium]
AIPARPAPGAPGAEPAVRALLDFFAWAGGDAKAFDRLLVSPAVDFSPGALRRLRRAAADEGVPLDEHPRLAALAALKHDIAPRLSSEDPTALAHEVWVRVLGRLVPDPNAERPDVLGGRALAALGAYLSALAERSAQDPSWRIADELALAQGPDLEPDPWLPAATAGEEDAVTVGTIRSAAGRSWDTVVVCGCLEGELPRLPSAIRFFDDALLDAILGGAEATTAGAPGLAPRREWALQRERQLFTLATSRARSRLALIAAPAPGQVVSRFVADLVPEPLTPALDAVAPVAVLAGTSLGSRMPSAPFFPTEGVAPVYRDRHLDLSASRLTTYDDCPLRYFYGYTLGVRGPGGVAASIGTMVHAALAGFLDPARSPDYSWPALEALAGSLWDEEWSETIAPYQPMREQARRDVFGMLQSWWDAEAGLAAGGSWPDVVAVEHPFEIDVGGHRVRGYIDRVDRVDGGLAIIDYKTGAKVPRQEEVTEDLQLATYHLAALRDPVLAAVGPPVSLQLSYLRSGAVVSQPISADHEQRTEMRILDLAQRILAEEFEPSVEADCEYCEFKRLCPLKDEGRRVVGE